MEANELIKKVRKIEIKTRGLSSNIFAGQYHSAFKGTISRKFPVKNIIRKSAM